MSIGLLVDIPLGFDIEPFMFMIFLSAKSLIEFTPLTMKNILSNIFPIK